MLRRVSGTQALRQCLCLRHTEILLSLCGTQLEPLILLYPCARGTRLARNLPVVET